MLLSSPLRRSACASLLLAAFGAPMFLPAATDYSRLIPHDAVLGVWTSNVRELKESFNNSPYGRLLADPQLDRLRGFVENAMSEFFTELGDDGEDLQALIDKVNNGAAFFGVASNFGPDGEFQGVLLAEMSEVDFNSLRSIFDKFGEEAEETTRDSFEVLGTQVFRITAITEPSQEELDRFEMFSQFVPDLDPPTGTNQTLMFTYTDDHAVIVMGKSREEFGIRATLAQIKQQVPTSLATRPEVGDLTDHLSIDSNKLHGFFNVGDVVAGLIKSAPEPRQSVERGIQTSGLDRVSTIFGSFMFNEESVDQLFTITTPAGRSGIVAALVDTPDNTLDLLRVAPADASGAVSFMFDLGAFYDSVVAVVESQQPGASAIVNLGLLSFQSEFGVNPLDQILKNIAGEHLYVTTELDSGVAAQLDEITAASSESSAIYFGLRNPDVTVPTLRSLLQQMAQHPEYGQNFSLREQGNVLIVSLPEMMAELNPLSPMLIVSDSHLVYVNNPIQLQQSIRALDGGLVNPMTERPSAQAAITAAGLEGLHTFYYYGPESVGNAVDQLRQVLQLIPLMTGAAPDFDPQLIPGGDLVQRYLGDGWSAVNRTPTAVRIFSRGNQAN